MGRIFERMVATVLRVSLVLAPILPNSALIGVLAHQELQKGGLAPAVAAGKAQLPAGVDLKADVFKNGGQAPLVAKGKVGYLDL